MLLAGGLARPAIAQDKTLEWNRLDEVRAKHVKTVTIQEGPGSVDEFRSGLERVDR